MYSNAWNGTAANSGYTQAIHWTNFMGNNAFCIKACDPAGPNAARYCEQCVDHLSLAVP